MKKLTKQIVAGMMLIMLVVLSACNSGGNKSTNESNTDNSEGTVAKGRYLEEDYSLPEEIHNIYAIRSQKDSSLRMVSDAGVFDSTDGGKTWTLDEKIDMTLYNGENYFINMADIDQEGNICMIHTKPLSEEALKTWSGVEYQISMIDKEGVANTNDLQLPELDISGIEGGFSMEAGDGIINEEGVGLHETDKIEADSDDIDSNKTDSKDIISGVANEVIAGNEDIEQNSEGDVMMISGNMENSLRSIEFSTNGDIVGFDIAGNVLVINTTTGEIKTEISNSDDTNRNYVHCIGDTILVNIFDGVELYDMSGNILDSNSAINDLLTTATGEGAFITGGGDSTLLVPEGDGDGFYYCNKDGLYHYSMGGTTPELLINGTLNSISDQSYSFVNIIYKEDNSILIIYYDSDYNLVVKNYTYSEEADVTPGTELKIYALYDSKSVRQAISIFNRNNPDIYAKLEIGIAEGSSVTETDAIKTLNTDIMAGSGPDILIMDGLSTQSFIDKGMLVDLSSLVKKVSDSDGLFENIVNTYESDGKLFVVPARFTVSLLSGKSEDVDNIVDLESLAEQVKKIKSENADMSDILGLNGETLLKSLFDISASTWLNEDGTLDETQLNAFLELVKEINDVEIEDKTEEQLAAYEDREQAMGLYLELQKLAISQIGSVSSFSMNQTICNKTDSVFKIANGQAQNTFKPFSSIGISAKSTNVEAAESFVRSYLSLESQNVTLEEGFPVNKAAFDTICRDKSGDENSLLTGMAIQAEDGSMKLLEVPWPSEDEIARLKNIVESLTTRAVTDGIIKNTVIENGVLYLSGAASLEDTVSNIMQQVNLYLAE